MTARIGVLPAAAATARRALLELVERRLPVRFEPLGDGGFDGGVDALVSFGRLNGQGPAGLRTLVFDAAPGSSRPGEIHFAGSAALDHALRGQAVPGEWSPRERDPGTGPEVLASAGDVPVWERFGLVDVVSAELPELDDGECLHDRLVPGRCLALVALLHFLRELAPEAWTLPPPKAVLVLDDPNLHWRTYGHVDFGHLARHADEHGYHLAFGHVPLDFRFFHHGTVRLFRSSQRLSLAIHGNNHTRRELGGIESELEADRVLAQALRRTRVFELKTGLRVSRVMIPPHEACSEAVMRELPRFGFEAVTLTRPHGYRYAFGTASPFMAPGNRAAGFEPAEVTEFGMPVLTRRFLDERAEVPLRGFLRQPIVLYGHPSDLGDGLEILEAAAASVNRLPGVAWTDLTTLSRANYATRLDGDALRVRPFARRLRVELPPDVRSVVFEPLLPDGDAPERELPAPPTRVLRVPESERTAVAAEGGRVLDVELVAPSMLNPELIPPPRRRPAVVLRRTGSEARDRVQALRAGRRGSR
jgi:hypothetical protein